MGKGALRTDAEDCTEDVFVKVMTGRFSFNDDTHERKWLTITAINLCKDKRHFRSCHEVAPKIQRCGMALLLRWLLDRRNCKTA